MRIHQKKMDGILSVSQLEEPHTTTAAEKQAVSRGQHNLWRKGRMEAGNFWHHQESSCPT